MLSNQKGEQLQPYSVPIPILSFFQGTHICTILFSFEPSVDEWIVFKANLFFHWFISHLKLVAVAALHINRYLIKDVSRT